MCIYIHVKCVFSRFHEGRSHSEKIRLHKRRGQTLSCCEVYKLQIRWELWKLLMQNLILKSTSIHSDREVGDGKNCSIFLMETILSVISACSPWRAWFQLRSWNTDQVLLPAHILALSKISQVQSHDRSYNFWQNYGAITLLLKSVCNYSAKRSRDLRNGKSCDKCVLITLIKSKRVRGKWREKTNKDKLGFILVNGS